LAQALQNNGVLPALHSLHFRVHTHALLTLVVALAVATFVIAGPEAGAGNPSLNPAPARSAHF
jgi:hypothetical protein